MGAVQEEARRAPHPEGAAVFWRGVCKKSPCRAKASLGFEHPSPFRVMLLPLLSVGVLLLLETHLTLGRG